MKSLSIRRQFAAEDINRVTNHPDVRPWVGGAGPLDLSAMVADPNNVLLMIEGGGCLFQKLGDGYYEVHTQFVPDARGATAVEAVREALWWMFCSTDAVEIVTKVPDTNTGALGLVRSIHGKFRFHRPRAWMNADGSLTGVKYFSKSLEDWVQDETDELAALGHAFHEKLFEAKTRMGASTINHDDDDSHDRYVGMACEMIARGQVAKGVYHYNRFGVFSGYATVGVVTNNPIVIDIGDALLAIRGGDFEVILCR